MCIRDRDRVSSNEEIPQFICQYLDEVRLDQVDKLRHVNGSSNRVLVIFVHFEIHLPDWRKREQIVWVYLSTLKYFFRDLVDISVLLSVAWSRLVEFSASSSIDNEVTTPLEDLEKDDHLLILHQVERTFLKVKWVLDQHCFNLLVQLTLDGLV